jgi:hypothetical protein
MIFIFSAVRVNTLFDEVREMLISLQPTFPHASLGGGGEGGGILRPLVFKMRGAQFVS